ncbi:MFS transporter [Pigmentiphaga sp. D-2]|uniref:MFS transporter n=1 Tax=Pigmentiphaga sp. D-2 TaxID=1002116 RepID=UPI00104DD8C7|nr:MFS transporter [Pigmentiphaga sp. D-2]
MGVSDLSLGAEADGRRTPLLTSGTIIARIERLTASGMQIRARLLVGMATFFDGFDAIAIATTLPLLIRQWGLSSTQIGLLIAAAAVGQLIGTFLFPLYAQRHGRVRAIAYSSGIIGITSIACGFAPSFEIFLLLRVIQGIGLGGELPVAATYINEITRAGNRGRFVLLYEIIYPIGLLASAALGAWLVPRHGWEIMYYLGGVPVVLMFLLPRVIPESPRWLAEKGRLADADTALARFESSARVALAEPQDAHRYDAMLASHPRRTVRDLFSRAYLSRNVVVALLWSSCGFIQYGLSTWLPTIYQTVYKVPLQQALNLSLGASALGVAGSLVAALTVDRFGRKPVIVAAFLLCAVTLGLAGALSGQSIYVVATLCSLAWGFLACGFIISYVYTPEMYPTSIRALGCGLGGTWVKLSAMIAPMIVAALMAKGSMDLAFYVLGAVPLLTALAVAWLGIETRGKVLEQLHA